MIVQPPEDWVQRKSVPTSEVLESNDSKNEKDIFADNFDHEDSWVHWKDALKSKEFYLLWITRYEILLSSD